MTPSTGSAPVRPSASSAAARSVGVGQQRLDDADRQRRAEPVEPLERRLRQQAARRAPAPAAAPRAPPSRRCVRAPRPTATRTLASSSSTNGASAAPARRSPMSPSASAMSLRCSGRCRARRAAPAPPAGRAPTSASTTALRRPTFSGSASAAASTSAASCAIAERRRARRRFLAHAPARIAHRLDEEVERLGRLVGVDGAARRATAPRRISSSLVAEGRAARRRARGSRALALPPPVAALLADLGQRLGDEVARLAHLRRHAQVERAAGPPRDPARSRASSSARARDDRRRRARRRCRARCRRR